MTGHVLDHPAWHALTTRQAHLALGDAEAVRFRPSVNVFGAARDAHPDRLAALAMLVPAGGTLGLIGAAPHPPVAGLKVQSAREIEQMVLTSLDRCAADIDIVPLGPDDVPDILALAALTAPGPFFAETRLQGGYVGVRSGGRLVAMAGERMKPPGFTRSARSARIPVSGAGASAAR